MRITTDHPASSYGQPIILDDDGNPMDFAAGVAAVRHRLGLTQVGLAKECGTSVATVRNWEQGRNRVETNALLVMSGLLAKMAREDAAGEAGPVRRARLPGR